LVAAAGLIVFSAKLGNRTDTDNSKLPPGSAAPPKYTGGPKPKKGKSKPKAHPVPDSPFYSLAACKAYVEAHPPRAAARAPRIATWNVRSFPAGLSGKDHKNPELGTDVPWLACTMAAMDVDVVAVQEVLQDADGKKALAELITNLDALTKGKWHASLDECSGGRQHLGFLYDESRVTVSGARSLAALNPGTSACDLNQRPGYAMYARFASGPDLHLVSVHLDSGQTKTDFEHRKTSLGRLGDVTKELGQAEGDSDMLVLGVFNANGCKECDPKLDDDAEVAAIGDQIKAAGLHGIALPKGRSCTQYTNKGKSTNVLDQVAASDMAELPKGSKIELFGPCADLGCKQPYRRDKVEAFDRLSDHCPLVVTLAGEDDDPNPAGKGAKKTAAPKAAAPKPAAPAAAAKQAAPATPGPLATP
jgi:endonuclease/exonuclease/phosphatase family metal-dependent hydrolase